MGPGSLVEKKVVRRFGLRDGGFKAAKHASPTFLPTPEAMWMELKQTVVRRLLSSPDWPSERNATSLKTQSTEKRKRGPLIG
jgi:hypothetical protein